LFPITYQLNFGYRFTNFVVASRIYYLRITMFQASSVPTCRLTCIRVSPVRMLQLPASSASSAAVPLINQPSARCTHTVLTPSTTAPAYLLDSLTNSQLRVPGPSASTAPPTRSLLLWRSLLVRPAA